MDRLAFWESFMDTAFVVIIEMIVIECRFKRDLSWSVFDVIIRETYYINPSFNVLNKFSKEIKICEQNIYRRTEFTIFKNAFSS